MDIVPDQRYYKKIEQWNLCDIMNDGLIKEFGVWKDIAYYPVKNCTTASDATLQRQRDFVQGSTFFPAVANTVLGSIGSVFRKPTDIELSPNLEYLRTNADGSGKGIEQVAQYALGQNVLLGYGGMLTDYAQGEAVQSQAQQAQQGRVATITTYDAQDIYRVSTTKTGTVDKISSIVLRETTTETINEFEEQSVTRYRLLALDENGEYYQRLYSMSENGKYDDYETIEPRDYNGKTFTEIPFSFFGAESNDYKVDNAPMYPLATMNLKYSEYSAMRNESIRQLAPTLFCKTQEDFDGEKFNTDNPDGLVMGAYNGYLGFENAMIVQPAPNDAALSEMTRLNADMLQAGANLVVSENSGVSTETTAIQKSTQTSVLGVIVRNVEDTINSQLRFCAQFMGGEDASVISINRDFINYKMSAAERTVWINDVMAGNVSKIEYRTRLQKDGEIVDVEDLDVLNG